MAMLYLLLLTAHRTIFPLGTAQIDQLLPDRWFRIRGTPIIGTWQLTTEERLLPTMAANCASALFMNFGFSLS
jgi:hypothetical protein